MRRALLAGGAVVAAGLAGCGGGGGGSSAGSYRSALDASCAAQEATIRALPQRQRDEHLTLDQARAAAEEAGRKNVERVAALMPPEELAATHRELVTLLRTPPDASNQLGPVVERTTAFQRLFQRLGATGCAAGSQRALVSLRAAAASRP